MGSRWLDPNLSPTVDAYSAKPYEIIEIDEHVDGPRIWATLLQAREEVEKQIDEAYERGMAEGYKEHKEE